MKFSNGKAEIELEHPNTFNIAERLGFKPVEEYKEPNKEIKKEILKEESKGKKLPADGFYNCKKCDFKTDNNGTLMAHYRKEHPKK